MLKRALNLFFQNKSVLILIIMGSLSWFLTIGKSGLKYDYGLGFWGANGYDGIWHVALINNFSNFDFTNPVLSGEKIKNYHIGYDLFLGLIKRITGIDSLKLYFQIFPAISSVIIGLLTYFFVFNWTGNKKGAILSTFFIYFGGSAAWVLGLGESAFWSQQAITTLINPPFALSLIFILAGLISLQKKNFFLSILFFGLLIQIKAYAAILVLAGLFFASLYSYYLSRSSYLFAVFCCSLILNLILFFAIKNDGLSSFKWNPFWFLETMFAAGDRLSWPKIAEAMLSYKSQSVLVKFVLSYGFAFFVFMFGNFWTRLIFVRDLFKKADSYKLFILSVIISGLLIPLFFIQSGTSWNTIQFLYYSLFFSGILAGIALAKLNKYLIWLILIATFPTTFLSLKNIYLTDIPPAIISNEEMEALNFLKEQEKGVVLTYPFDSAHNFKPVPNKIPLYKYSFTSYVPALTSKNIYFERTNVEMMGYKWQGRKDGVIKFFTTNDLDFAVDFLQKNDIKYLYLVKEATPFKDKFLMINPSDLDLSKIFENEVSIIYRYDKNFGRSQYF